MRKNYVPRYFWRVTVFDIRDASQAKNYRVVEGDINDLHTKLGRHQGGMINRVNDVGWALPREYLYTGLVRRGLDNCLESESSPNG